MLFKTEDHHSPIVIADFGIAKYLEYLPEDIEPNANAEAGPSTGSQDAVRKLEKKADGHEDGDGGGLGKGEGGVDSVAGSFGYAAPEVLGGKRHGVKVDCWSIGYVLFPLLPIPKHTDRPKTMVWVDNDHGRTGSGVGAGTGTGADFGLG